MIYHINSKGEPGLCKAQKACPFGGSDAHFTSKEAARFAFEALQSDVFSGKFIPQTKEGFDSSIFAIVPEAKDSKIGKQPIAADHEGYMGGTRFIGGLAQPKKADGTNDYVSQTEAAKGIRDLISQAKKAGELPSWVNISVRKNSGAWVSSIAVEISYKPEGKVQAIPEAWRETPRENNPLRTDLTEAAERLESYVKYLSSQFEQSENNSMVDYFSSNNAARVSWRDSWQD